jgi:signal transduction histidine kinase/ActR/RegA family two-component response regulator
MHPQDAQMDREQRERVLAGEIETYSLEARYLCRDGASVWAKVTAGLLCDPDGRPLHFIAAIEDITQRRQLNAQLAAATETAVKASRAKSEFLSSMSHELRTPLNAILGFAQLLEQATPALSVAQARGVQHILKGGWYLLDLVNEILDLALIDAGQLALAMAPAALAPLLLDCQSMSENQARETGIHMEFAATPLHVHVHADRKRLMQVLLNLLSNAIKYNRPGGSVTVTCTRQRHGRLRIAVADTGLGLAPLQLEQLFEPFNRLGQENHAIEGTGIGLVVARRLVEQMGGAMGVESEVGKGSNFWVELDIARQPTPALAQGVGAQAVAGQSPPVPGIRKVLCVEDNEANLLLVQDVIATQPGLLLLTARDGQAGLDKAREQLPDVVLLDINLPDISGLQVLKLLARDPATAHIPVIALSANAMPQDIATGLESGFFDYLAKPIRIATLLHTLEVALNHAPAALAPVGTNG